MADSFVGLENLPNVYFRDITVSTINTVEGQEKSSIIEVKLVINDTQENGTFQWADNDLLNTYLNVTLVQSLDKNFTQQITSGQYTLNSFDFKTSPDYDRSSVKRMIKRLRPEGVPEDYAVGGGMYEFEYTFSFEIKDENLIDVAYFAALTIDQAMLSADYMADFDNAEMRYFQGPISSEKVFVDGALQTTTNVFYLPDNQIWSGPVHIHEGNYMAGAFHKPTPHPMLRLVETQNLKLKDNRDRADLPKVNIINKKSRFFGTPYDTYDEEKNIKRLFSFDIESIFLEKTKYGLMIKNLDSNLYDQALQDFTIDKLVITRNQLVSRAISKTYSETCLIYKDEKQSTIFSDDCEISELNLLDNKSRFFNFVDKKIKNIKYGKHFHSIELSFSDKTKNLLTSLYGNYKNTISKLERYYLRSNKNVYKKNNGNFNKSFYTDEVVRYGLDNIENFNLAPWIYGPEEYVTLRSYLYDLNLDEKTSLYNSLYNSINPNTGTAKGISIFVQMYRDLLREFEFKFDLNKIILGTASQRRQPTRSGLVAPSKNIKLKKVFDNVFDSAKKPGYRLFEKEENINGLPILGHDIFDKRRNYEKNRFFSSNPNLNFDESKTLEQDEISSLIDIDTYSTSYLSPISFINKSRNIDLTNNLQANKELLNSEIESIFANKKSNSIFNKVLSLQKFSSNNLTSNDKNNSFQDASDYMGTESKFLNLSSDFATEDLELIEKIRVKEKLSEAVYGKRNKQVKFKDKFDLTKNNNIIASKKRAKKNLAKSLRKLPLHVKSIITSRSKAVKNDILVNQADLLRSTKNENIMTISHFGVQKIEFLDGFKKNKHGKDIFNLPNWKELDLQTFQTTNKDLFCRVISYYDEESDISLPEELSFEVFDKFFIIKSDTTSAANTITQDSIKITNLNNINYDYSTTNPVSQPLKENSIFTEQPQPNRPQADVQVSTQGSAISSRQRRGGQRAVSRATSNIRGTY